MKNYIFYAVVLVVCLSFSASAQISKPTPTPLSEGEATKALNALKNVAERKNNLNSKAKSWVRPEYPSYIVSPGVFGGVPARHRGDVSVKVNIDKLGNVTKAEAVSGENDLGKAAAKAALLAKFEPAMKNGKAIEQTGIVVFTFDGPPDPKRIVSKLRCTDLKFYVCEQPAFDFSDADKDAFKKSVNDLTPAKYAPEAEVDRLMAEFDKTFAKLTAGLAAKDADASKISRAVNCGYYDTSKKQLRAVFDRIKQMDADKQPPYVMGRAEFDKRREAFDLVKRPQNCTLFV